MVDKERIRRAEMKDGPELTDMTLRLARESEGRDLDPLKVEAGVKAVIKDQRKGFFLVMENLLPPGGLLGQMMITPEWSDWNNQWYWWLQSVYVREEARRSGVFRALYRHILEEARYRREVHGIRLYVEKSNHRAREAYLALGMQQAPYDIFTIDF